MESDEHLIDRLQRAAFSYCERFANPVNGLVADTSAPDFPCSIAAVGFALTAWPVAVERDWRSRKDALRHVLAAIRFFDGEQGSQHLGAISHRGFFYHFLDMQTGRRAWNGEVSFIDTAILLAGMQTAAAYFDGEDGVENELRERVDRIASRVDWPWACDRALRLRMG